ncbi:hypothetical protein HETIRDRAFT_237186, partial [Heterobasidion irregulare TC 32-1]
YGCTTKRWIYNEAKQMKERYVEFDVIALQKVAADVAGAATCTSMEKFAEGSFNKVFLLRFDNNKEVIVRIPCPIAGPQNLVIASEVATLDYVARYLHIPTPRVLAWSRDGSEFSVGVGYIIMERLPGVPLTKRWMDIRGDDFYELTERVVSMEKSFSDKRFSQIGSLYFKQDVAPELQARPLYAKDFPDDGASERYRIGPTVQREFWRGERSTMNIDRGPWPETQSYARAIVNCEKQWLRAYARPRPLNDPCRLSDDDASPEAHIEALDHFLAVLPFLNLPEEYLPNNLWHPDLYDGNIMVEAEGVPNFTGIIDWQHAWIGPRFMQAEFCRMYLYTGTMIDMKSTFPRLPDYFESLSPEDQEEAKLQKRLAERHKSYMMLVSLRDPLHADITRHPCYRTYVTPFKWAGRTWTDGIAAFRHALLVMTDDWKHIAGPDVPCPISFSKAEEERQMATWRQATAREKWVETFQEKLHLRHDGLVDPDQYESTKRAAEELR